MSITLPKPPEKYDANDQAQMRAILEKADALNQKKSTGFLNSLLLTLLTVDNNIIQRVSGSVVERTPAQMLLGLLTADGNVLQRKSGAVTQRTPTQLAADLASVFAANSIAVSAVNLLALLTADDMFIQRKSGAISARTPTQVAADIAPVFGALSISPSAIMAPCSFSAYVGTTVANVTGDGTTYGVICNTVLSNIGSAYNGTTGVFTAPVTGRYAFFSGVRLSGLGAAHTYGFAQIFASAVGYRTYEGNPATAFGTISGTNVLQMGGSVIVDMTAGDTAQPQVRASNGTKTVSMFGGGAGFSYFNGQRIS